MSTRGGVGVMVGWSEKFCFLRNLFAESLTDHWILYRKLQCTRGNTNKWKNKTIINSKKKEKIISEQKYIHSYIIGLAVNDVHFSHYWYELNCDKTIRRMGRKRLKGDAIEDSLIPNFDLRECQKILSKNYSKKSLSVHSILKYESIVKKEKLKQLQWCVERGMVIDCWFLL